jgi:hypothetical protein
VRGFPADIESAGIQMLCRTRASADRVVRVSCERIAKGVWRCNGITVVGTSAGNVGCLSPAADASAAAGSRRGDAKPDGHAAFGLDAFSNGVLGRDARAGGVHQWHAWPRHAQPRHA